MFSFTTISPKRNIWFHVWRGITLNAFKFNWGRFSVLFEWEKK